LKGQHYPEGPCAARSLSSLASLLPADTTPAIVQTHARVVAKRAVAMSYELSALGQERRDEEKPASTTTTTIANDEAFAVEN
jgi:hypothetical protein